MSDMQDQIHSATNESSSTPEIAKSAKLRDPEPFTGNPTKLFNFLSDCRLKFKLQPHYFSTEFTKIGWAATHLSGTAKLWWTTRFTDFESGKQDVPELESFKAFASKLNELFGHPDLARTKTNELFSLRQTTSVARYATEFTSISQFLDWSDAALKYVFEIGLKPDVKDGLSFIPTPPATLQELINTANKIDIRRYQHRKIDEKSAVPISSWAHPASTCQSTRLPEPKPTSISDNCPTNVFAQE
jgi:hypothetical protein